jgi:CRP-like cAMP-binding protein
MTVAVTIEQTRQNHILASLEDAEIERLRSKLELVEFELGNVVYESGQKMEHAYFPTTAVVSMLYLMENGGTAEIGIIGNDGMLGMSLFLGGDTTTSRAVIQSAGEALMIKPEDLRDEFGRAGRFQDLLLRYTQALMTQISQTAVCNRLHEVEEQLCRWLLLSHDRLNSDKLVMTHDLISNMLGVRREGVTLAAKKLASRKLIKNTRGTIEIIDRHGLEAAACECYEIVNTEYNRLLGRGVARTFT